MLKRILAGILFAIFAIGCVAQKPIVMLDAAASCDEIVPTSLLAPPFDELAQGQLQTENWILSQFPTATINFEPSSTKGDGDIGWFFWSVNDKPFSLYFHDGNRYIFYRFEQYPTLGQILRCFGEPQYYTLGDATIGGEASSAVLLRLWYPDRGLYFASTTWGSSEIRRYNADSPLVGEFRIMPSDTVEEMMKWAGLGKRYFTEEGALLREWPENFTEIMVEE